MSSQVKHCTAYMITLIVLLLCISYCRIVFFRRLLLSSAYGSTCDWTGFLICQEWERVEVSTDVRHQWLCVNLGWWFDFNIMRLLQLRGDCSQQQHRYAFFMLRLLQTQQRKQWNWPRTLWMRHGWRGWTKSLTCICSVDELHLDIYF